VHGRNVLGQFFELKVDQLPHLQARYMTWQSFLTVCDGIDRVGTPRYTDAYSILDHPG
jgi:hypothetical protein